MKIVRLRRMLPINAGQRRNAGDIHRGLIAFRALKSSHGLDKRLAGDHQAKPVERSLVHEKIGNACLVLQGNEAMPLGGTGSLAADGHARDYDGNSMWEFLQIRRTEHLWGS